MYTTGVLNEPERPSALSEKHFQEHNFVNFIGTHSALATLYTHARTKKAGSHSTTTCLKLIFRRELTPEFI